MGKKKLKIKKDDVVIVISGVSKGKEGKVIKVNSDTNRVVVEGVNIISKHTKPNAANPEGGIVKKESSIHISNLMLVDPKLGVKTRVGRRKDEETGKLIRFSKKSQEIIK